MAVVVEDTIEQEGEEVGLASTLDLLTTVVFSPRAFIRIALISETNTRRKIYSQHTDNNNLNMELEVKVSTKEAEEVVEVKVSTKEAEEAEEAKLNMAAVPRMTILQCWKKPFQAFQDKIIPFTLKFLKQVSPVLAKSMEVTTVIPRRSAKCSTSARTMDKEVSANTRSCVPTEPSSTKNTSFVIGGSTSTAQKLKLFTASTRKLPRNERPPLKRCCLQPLMVKLLT